jgi:hypothetical protein
LLEGRLGRSFLGNTCICLKVNKLGGSAVHSLMHSGFVTWRRVGVRRVWVFIAIFAVLASYLPAAVLDPDELAKPGAELFTNGPVTTIEIEITKTGMDDLRRDPRVGVPAVVREGGKVYRDVAVHLKGAAGSFRGVDNKPGMMLNFSKMTPGQKFHGHKRLMLNNSVQDPSYLNEYLCGYLFRQAGVPSPRTGHALVVINGKQQGLYVTKEDYSEDFLKRWFKDTRGNLYDIHPGRDVSEEMRLDGGSGPTNWADLKAAAAACQERDPAVCWEKLQKTVDTERFLPFLVLETLSSHWDGYSNAKNNFRIYSDPTSGRLVFIPSDTDQTFREPGRDVYQPGDKGLVGQAIMRTPEGRRRYYQSVEYVANKVYNLAALTNRVQETAARLRPALVSWNANAGPEFDNQVKVCLDRLRQRDETVKAQVNRFADRGAKFKDGVCKLAGWGPTYEGGADLRKLDKPAALWIRAGKGGAPSWRSHTVLPPGHYQFEGKVKTVAVNALKTPQGEGAGLRVNGKAVRQNKLSGDADWQVLSYGFDVTTDGEEVDLVCELRANKGEAWFEVGSLQLKKVK